MHRRLPLCVAVFFIAIGCGGGSNGTGAAGSNGAAGSGAAGMTGSAGATATGTGGTVAPPSGVDGTKALVDASDTDKMKTCDWFADLAGGYGATSPCAHALNAPQSQADCLATFPSCDATFSDFEGCVTAIVHAQQPDACTNTSVQDAQASAACSSVIPAGCFQ